MAKKERFSGEPGRSETAQTLRAVRWLIGIILTLAFPLATVLAAGLWLIAERRLVRMRWWLTWLALSIAACIAPHPADWWRGGLTSAASMWLGLWRDGTSSTLSYIGVSTSWLDAASLMSIGQIAWHQVLVAVPLALLIVTVRNLLTLDERVQAGKIEGAEFANNRPVGVLDRARARRAARRMHQGHYSTVTGSDGSGVSAIGIGLYGHPVTAERGRFKKATLILGKPRQGKTRLATSLASQQVRAGGAWILLDFKGDRTLAAQAADVAAELGRSFYHFELADTTGRPYAPPHPYASPRPAPYDPLGSGNGTTKAGMLLDSVQREGDAAAYKRTAEELVQLGFDIADLALLTEHVDPQTGQRVSGLEVATKVLDPEYVNELAHGLTVEHVQYRHPSMRVETAQRLIEDLQARTLALSTKVRRNGVVQGAIEDTAGLLSRLVNASATAGLLRPSINPGETINLVRAVLRGEVIVFSLNVQAYRDFATMLGNIVLLDLQNAVQTLRNHKGLVAELTGIDPRAADATPWVPATVQVEEFGTGNNAVILGLLNKSSGEGIRVILSSQSWADLIAVDDGGSWSDQVMEQVDNFMCFAINTEPSEAAAMQFSGIVTKYLPNKTVDVREANVLGAGRGARRSDEVRGDATPTARLDAGLATALHPGEFYWITKNPPRIKRGQSAVRVVHTIKEGPNRWSEPLDLVVPLERGLDWNAWTDGDQQHRHETAMQGRAALDEATTAMRTDRVIAGVLNTARVDDQQSALRDLQTAGATIQSGSDTEPRHNENTPPVAPPVDDPWQETAAPPAWVHPHADTASVPVPAPAAADPWQETAAPPVAAASPPLPQSPPVPVPPPTPAATAATAASAASDQTLMPARRRRKPAPITTSTPTRDPYADLPGGAPKPRIIPVTPNPTNTTGPTSDGGEEPDWSLREPPEDDGAFDLTDLH